MNAIPLYKNEIFIRTKRYERIWIYGYVKGYGFTSFARSISNNYYGKKLVDTAKNSAADAVKTASKRAMQKTAEATGDLIGNKIADKITSVSKKKSNNSNGDVELATHKKRYISPDEIQKITDELRLVTKNY